MGEDSILLERKGKKVCKSIFKVYLNKLTTEKK
jgi:hypothetical protein